MAEIRRTSIKGTIWIYTGFLIGAINTYFLTHKNWFTPDENGLTRALLDIGMLIFAFSSFGTTFFLYKFFPYYQDNLPAEKNDILGLSVKISLAGFAITSLALFVSEPLIVKKFGTNSALLVEYFYIAIPLGFFILLYNLLEAYSFGFGKAVTVNMLKETVLRLFTLSLILLKICNLISFRTFLILFSFQYALIIVLLGAILKKEGNLSLAFKSSRVTQKFRKKIITLLSLTFLALVASVLRTTIDGVVLAARQDLKSVAIFGFAAYLVTVMQAPFRSMVSVTIPLLSRFWKEKNLSEIIRIYRRSSINLLTFALFTFYLILLNFSPAIQVFNLNPQYLTGKSVFILLGIVTVIEMGTGINGQIIGTSVYWRFELWTSFLLTALIIPLSYMLTVKYGLVGPAIANLVSFTVYNSIRYYFLKKKFNMQPFSIKTLEIFIIGTSGFFISYFIFQQKTGLIFIVCRSLLFVLLFIVPVYFRNISPDLKPVLNSLSNKFLKRKRSEG